MNLADLRARAGHLWLRLPNWLLYGVIGYVVFLGLNVAVISRGIPPDFDGITYVNFAMKLNLGLSGMGMERFVTASGPLWDLLPFTNTLDVMLLALVYNILDYHVAIWLIHSVYIALFAYFARRIFSPAATLVLVAWAISNTYFLHLYTTLLSEMKVGMFLVLFIAFVFHEDTTKHLRSLFWVTVILILQRTINIAFIFPLVALYAAIRYFDKERRKEIPRVAGAVGLAVVVLSPLLVYETGYLVEYISRNGANSAQNWRDMSGVYSKLDLLLSYGGGVVAYNREFAVAAGVALAAGAAFYLTRARGRLATAMNYALGSAVVFAVLMQAMTNNIMVVYWVYMLLGLVTVGVASAILDEQKLTALALAAMPFALMLNHSSYVRAHQEVVRKRPLVEVAKELSDAVPPLERPVVCMNYGGVGPLDLYGIELLSGRRFGTPGIDTVSYRTDAAQYIKSLNVCNVAFVANRNFMWPAFLGINHQTEPIAQFLAERASEVGFTKSRRLMFDSDPSRYIDVYVRPTMQLKMKYLRYNDKWLDGETALTLRAADPAQRLDGYTIEIDVAVPSVPDPGFALPLKATLVADNGRTVASTVIEHAGPNKLTFPLDGVVAGGYRLLFDKTFAPKGDQRRLAALYTGSVLKFEPGNRRGEAPAPQASAKP
jgi:hypothetical protein